MAETTRINKEEKRVEAVAKRIAGGYMPNSVEAEEAVLGALLSDRDVLIEHIGELYDEDFYNPRLRKVFAKIKELSAANLPVDVVVVANSFAHDGELDAVGGLSALSALTESIPSTANCAYYIRIIKNHSQMRKLIRACYEIIAGANEMEDADKVLSIAESLIFKISEEKDVSTLVHISGTLVELMKVLNESFQSRDAKRGLMTYQDNYDELTGGLLPGQLIVLAARPGCGKTSFVMNVVTDIARRDKEKVVAVFNLEMSAQELAGRMLANITGVNPSKAADGTMTEFNTLWTGENELNTSNVYIDDSAYITSEQIMSKCRRLKAQKGKLDLVVIDYLQLISSSRIYNSKQTEVSEISRSMKIMAKELRVPIILLSQMSRSIEQRDDKTPKLSDLRESGAIEQDADMVMFLTEGDFEVFSDVCSPIEMIVAKHRNGATGSLYFKWNKELMVFTPEYKLIPKAKSQDGEKEAAQPSPEAVGEAPPEGTGMLTEVSYESGDYGASDDAPWDADIASEAAADAISDDADGTGDMLSELKNSEIKGGGADEE